MAEQQQEPAIGGSFLDGICREWRLMADSIASESTLLADEANPDFQGHGQTAMAREGARQEQAKSWRPGLRRGVCGHGRSDDGSAHDGSRIRVLKILRRYCFAVPPQFCCVYAGLRPAYCLIYELIYAMIIAPTFMYADFAKAKCHAKFVKIRWSG